MEADRLTADYAGPDHRVCIEFEAEGHTYGIGPTPEDLSPVPSFSDIAEFLPKYLVAWGQGIGVKGLIKIIELARAEELPPNPWLRNAAKKLLIDDVPPDPITDPKFLIRILVGLGLDHNGVRNAAADRGTSVHNAFRGFVLNGVLPDPEHYTGEVRGYIVSLRMFCEALAGHYEPILCEEPIASPTLGIAGTPDLLADVSGATVQTGGNIGPNKRPKFEQVSGKCLVDLKTSADVYVSHTWQLSAYERMLTECGFEAPDTRAIVLIKADGAGYNWKPQESRVHAIPHLVAVYNAEHRPLGWPGFQYEEAVA